MPVAQTTGPSCFGYVVQSSLRFSFLRPGAGTRLAVREANEAVDEPDGEPLLAWPARPDAPQGTRLYRRDGRYLLWNDREDWVRIEPAGPAITVSRVADRAAQEARLWGIPLALCFAPRGDVPLHAAAIEINGSAVVLAAPGGYGKTTLAAACVDAGYRLLSEDITCCRLSPAPAILPGPAVLRVRADVYPSLALTHTHVAAVDAGRFYLSVDDTNRGDGLPVPLGAVVLLRPPAASLRLVPVTPAASLPDLWSLSFRLPTDEDRARCFQGIATLASTVPVWNLCRPRTIESLPEVVDALARVCAAA